MALSATVHHLVVTLSDVDRNVYETLDLRIARHPSETMRYMLTRTIAYALSYEDGIAFSKGGLSDTETPPIAIHDPTGILLAWIDIGAPSAERLHKAAKAARRVAVFTTDLAALRRAAAEREIHRAAEIEVWSLSPSLLDALEPKVGRNTKLDLTRTDGTLYITIDNATLEAAVERSTLASALS